MNNPYIYIKGPCNLKGTVEVSGAKNAALPCMATAILTKSNVCLKNIPEVEDIKIMKKALEDFGALISLDKGTLSLSLKEIIKPVIPTELSSKWRASILTLGPLLARNGYAKVSMPGGCPIGDRKINFHLEGLRLMGADININMNSIEAQCQRLKGIDYTFPDVSVTGTENLIMAAVLAEGKTILRNCALEPEIADLIEMLKAMGANIRGKDSRNLEIEGVKELQGCNYRIISDRIEAGTYLLLGAMPDNELEIKGVNINHLSSLISVLKECGVSLDIDKDSIKVCGKVGLNSINVTTAPFPSFPTDLQAQITAFMLFLKGVSRVEEKIFNNRFQHIKEMKKLGADLELKENFALVKGVVKELKGNCLKASDLRASAALVMTALKAKGETRIYNAYQLLRGYENMPGKLRALGADILLKEE